MNRAFEPREYFTVPDGTDVSAFLNATDATQPDLPWGILGEMSVAAGRIAAGVHSSVHVLPAVTQLVYLLTGRLTVRMIDRDASESYDVCLVPGQAAVSQPGTVFQLRNDGEATAEVLYVVSPSFVFEKEGDSIRYDDAILVAETWQEFVEAAFEIPALAASAYEARARRAESLRRLAAMKGHAPSPLADDHVVALREKYDYLAPDGSEIRLLVEGQLGGLARCTLPAGRISSPVYHRTVEELWYVLQGNGAVWRARKGESRTDPVSAGDSVRIPVGTSFQFRADRDGDLELLLATMPPWPGPQEAVPLDGGNGWRGNPRL